MSLFSKLFGGRSETAPEPAAPEPYQGFRIYPAPIRESGGFRLAARIEKEIDGETRRHELIRADVFQSAEEAAAFSITKAKQMIDQIGDRVFD